MIYNTPVIEHNIYMDLYRTINYKVIDLNFKASIIILK